MPLGCGPEDLQGPVVAAGTRAGGRPRGEAAGVRPEAAGQRHQLGDLPGGAFPPPRGPAVEQDFNGDHLGADTHGHTHTHAQPRVTRGDFALSGTSCRWGGRGWIWRTSRCSGGRFLELRVGGLEGRYPAGLAPEEPQKMGWAGGWAAERDRGGNGLGTMENPRGEGTLGLPRLETSETQ